MSDLKILGIDIAKRKFDVALIANDKFKSKAFSNDLKGFEALSEWLIKYEVTALHACMEATNTYGNALANYLFEKQFTVSVVNPAQIKHFANAQLSRNKNDTLDAQVIARFCELMKPKVWTPTPLPIAQLQALVQRLNALLAMQTQETNRIDTADNVVKQSLQDSLEHFVKQIASVRKLIEEHIQKNPDLKHKAELLRSIPGVGSATIAAVLAGLPDVKNFTHQNQVVAFAGLNPKQKLSGSSVHGKTPLSKVGHSALRKALYMPAMVAIRCNPVFIAMAQRLTANRKSKMLILGAAMRKLLVLIYGILKSNLPFNPEMAMPR